MCKWVVGSVQGFPANKTVSVSCVNGSGTFWTFTFTTRSDGGGGWGEGKCLYGMYTPMWVVADGVKSKEIARNW